MKTFLIYSLVSLPLFVVSQQKLDALFKKSKVTGVQLVVTNNNNKVQEYYYGETGSGEHTRITGSSIFQAASLSKVVLAFITLKLYDSNIIALDTPLYKYYQYERIKDDSDAKKITARMVLHHQTGFPNWAANPTAKQWATSALKTNNKPGITWSYSGEGFMYLQLAIEHLLKQSLEEIAVKEVFTPLNMKSSSFIWKKSFETNAVFGHNKKGEITGRTQYFLPGGAYSLLTTAGDFNKFVQALVIGNGLSLKAHQLMLSEVVSVKKSATTSEAANHIFWGLGVGIQENELGKAIWHWGDNGDFKCFFMALPGKNKSLVYFTNSENGLKPVKGVLDYYFGKKTWWAVKWLDKDF